MLTVILKSLDACNMRCIYCSVGDKSTSRIMSASVMKSAFEFIAEYANLINEKDITIILHGGEPMLIGYETYSTNIDYIIESYPELDFTISLQTNGSYLSEGWIEFLKKYKVHVGVSIDGSKRITDLQRITLDCTDSAYEIITANIRKLKKEGISVSALMVLTQNSLSDDFKYLKFFDDEQIQLKINPLLIVGEAKNHLDISLKPGQYAEYLISLFEYVLDNQLDFSILPIEDFLVSALYKVRPHGCTFSDDCVKKFICIDPEGSVFPCGRFSDEKVYKLGDIYSVKPVANNELRVQLERRRSSELPSECIKCKWVSYCNAGCSASAVCDGSVQEKSPLCIDYKALFEYFHGAGLKKYKEYLLNQREYFKSELLKLNQT